MDWTTGLGWWTAATPQGADLDTPDRADMGTAFGLDASLVPWEDEFTDEVAEPAPASAWQRRLVRRTEP